MNISTRNLDKQKYYHMPFLLVHILCMSHVVKSQKRFITNFEVGGFVGSSRHLPFWLRANQYGAIPDQAPALFSTFESHSIPQGHYRDTVANKSRKIFDWNYDFEIALSLGAKSDLYMVEGAVTGRIGFLNLMIGKKKEIFGLVDTLLSSGSMIWSGNARPIPKIQIGTNGYTTVPFTRKVVSFQFTYAHGWLGELRINPLTRLEADNRFNGYSYYLETYLHQKSFFLRLGKPQSRTRLFGGFTHVAQYGNDRILSPGAYSPLSDKELYEKVVFGKTWAQSKVGNHLGTIDLGAEIRGKRHDFFIYRQNFFENGSLLNALNRDGLSGICITKKQQSSHKLSFRKLLVEYLYTNDQVDPLVPSIGSRNDYYNHDLYYDGWSYKGRVMGTPMATIDRDMSENVNKDGFKGGYVANNRIYALHIAFMGTYEKKINFQFRCSLSNNQGTYFFPFATNKNQFSTSLSIEKLLDKISNSSIKLNWGADVGTLFKSNTGIYVGFCKKWL